MTDPRTLRGLQVHRAADSSRRVSRVAMARAGFTGGALAAAVGLFLAVGLGWALVGFGAATSAAFVFLFDVDEPESPPPATADVADLRPGPVQDWAAAGDW